jgi:hypothetical protein
MRDLRKYWQEIREIEKSLPEFVWLTSLDNAPRGQRGGCIAQVAAAAAARLLHANRSAWRRTKRFRPIRRRSMKLSTCRFTRVSENAGSR